MSWLYNFPTISTPYDKSPPEGGRGGGGGDRKGGVFNRLGQRDPRGRGFNRDQSGGPRRNVFDRSQGPGNSRDGDRGGRRGGGGGRGGRDWRNDRSDASGERRVYNRAESGDMMEEDSSQILMVMGIIRFGLRAYCNVSHV